MSLRKSNQVNNLFNLIFGLLGIIIVIATELNNYLILPFFLICGLIGYGLRPYDKNGKHRY